MILLLQHDISFEENIRHRKSSKCVGYHSPHLTGSCADNKVLRCSILWTFLTKEAYRDCRVRIHSALCKIRDLGYNLILIHKYTQGQSVVVHDPIGSSNAVPLALEVGNLDVLPFDIEAGFEQIDLHDLLVDVIADLPVGTHSIEETPFAGRVEQPDNLLREELPEIRIRLGEGIVVDCVEGFALFDELGKNVLPPPFVDRDAWLLMPSFALHVRDDVWMRLDDVVRGGRLLLEEFIYDAHAVPDVQHAQARRGEKLLRRLCHDVGFPSHHDAILVLI